MESNYDDIDDGIFSYRQRHSQIFGKKVVPLDYARVRKPFNGDVNVFDASFDCAAELIKVRSRWLVENHPELKNSFLKNPDLYKIARKYVKYDYKISPRTARRIIYGALQKLVDESELKGIEEDPMPPITIDLGDERPRKRRRKVLFV